MDGAEPAKSRVLHVVRVRGGASAIFVCSASLLLLAAAACIHRQQQFTSRFFFIYHPRQYSRAVPPVTAGTPRNHTQTTCPSFTFANPDNYRYIPGSVPTALASYPGSGSTLTRLLLEVATEIYTGSVYGDVSLYNNTAHRFLGEFHRANVSCVKVSSLLC